MSTFVYYNPKTNTIERRFPAQPIAVQIPYLLNIQPQNFNYAVANNAYLQSNPTGYEQPSISNKTQPTQEYQEVEKKSVPYGTTFEKENKNWNQNFNSSTSDVEVPKKSSQKPRTNEFLIMEDLREEDIPQLPQLPKTQPTEIKRNNRNQATENPKSSGMRKAQARSPIRIQEEEEAKGEFHLMRPEEFMMKHQPEREPQEYSLNERILNAKFVRQEQEKTNKFIMNRIGNDIKEMEKMAATFEKEIKSTEEDTKKLDEMAKKMWEEVERKKFEVKAKEILDNINRAVDIKDEEDHEEKIEELFKENQALYAEIDRVLEGDTGDYERSVFEIRPAARTVKATSNITKRPTSTGVTGRSKIFENKPLYSSRSPNLLDKKLGQKSMVKVVTEEKTKGATRIKMKDPKKEGLNASGRRELFVKNPKKFEEALIKAKQIADMYE